jgi:hypothetical protein
MSRRLRIILSGLVVAVAIAGFYSPRLYRTVLRLARPARTEEQARREVTQPPIATPTDVEVKARIFWASTTAPGILEPVEIELALSADPVLRSKQLINALIADAPSPEQHTLPEDATLLEFYLLPDGTAVADFSDTLSTETPSGILNEQMAVDSIARTLAANVAAVRRLKILIHGQEAETLAGHLDLTGYFAVRAEAPAAAPAPPASVPGKAPGGGLTPPGAPGKLGY